MIQDSVIIHTFPTGEKVVGMEKFNDAIYIATEWNVYRLENGQLVRLEIKSEDSNA